MLNVGASIASALIDRAFDARRMTLQWRSRRAIERAEQAAQLAYEALAPQDQLELPGRLTAKYARKAVLGKVRIFNAVAALAPIIDPFDPGLGCVGQLTHQLQVATAMERAGLDETFVIGALVHDIGKLLIDTDEEPINVEAGGSKVPLAGTIGGGLMTCTFRWDHGDFAYLRLRDYLPDHLAWLVRHHSIDVAGCEPYMNEQDRVWVKQYFVPFVRYDNQKNMFALPPKRLRDYRALLDRTFPEQILI